MFESFTSRAVRAVKLAAAESGRLGHNFVGTEHLLLGILQEGRGAGALALAAAGVSSAQVESEVIPVDEGAERGSSTRSPFTPNAKVAIEAAVPAARRMGRDEAGTNDLLFALIQREGHAAEILRAQEIDLAALGSALLDVEDDPRPDPPAEGLVVAKRTSEDLRTKQAGWAERIARGEAHQRPVPRVGTTSFEERTDRDLRVGVLEAVEWWLADPDGSPILLISGEPGAGKSEVAAQIAPAFALAASGRTRQGAVALRAGSTGGTTDALVLLSEVLQLASEVDPAGVQADLARLHGASDTIRATVDVAGDVPAGASAVAVAVDRMVVESIIEPGALFEHVIAPALARGRDGEPVIIVADGLDEGVGDGSIAAFLARIAAGTIASPAGIRWVATSRPDERFGRTRTSGRVTEIHLEQAHHDDVSRFLADRLVGMGWVNPAEVAAAVDACDGNYLVARYLIDELTEDPTMDLAVFTSGGLAGVYDRFLARLAARHPQPEDLEDHLGTLTLIAAAGSHGITVLAAAAVQDIPVLRVRAITAGAAHYLGRSTPSISCYHPSFADHLLAQEGQGSQADRARDAHLSLARYQIEDALAYRGLDAEQVLRLPWHLDQAVELTAPGPDRSRTERAVAQLGWRLFHTNGLGSSIIETLGRRADADPSLTHLLESVLGALGDLDMPTTEATLATRYHLAFRLGSAGRVQAAIDQLELVVEERTASLGADHADTLRARRSLASFVGELGRTGDMLARYEAVLADRMEALGPDHAETLTARGNVASALLDAGRHREAVAHQQAILAERIRTLGPDHPYTLTTRHNLAVTLSSAGDHQTAVAQLRALVPDRGRLNDEDDPGMLRTKRQLAIALVNAGETAESLEVYDTVLADYLRVFGPDHLEMLDVRMNHAAALRAAGEPVRAVEELSDVLERERRMLGPDHPSVHATGTFLAGALSSAGRVDEAVALQTQLLGDAERIFGPDHPETFTARNNFAHLLAETGHKPEALERMTALIADKQRTLGSESRSILDNRITESRWRLDLEGPDAAVEPIRALTADIERMVGPDAPELIRVRALLTRALGGAGDDAANAAARRQLYADRTKSLGPDHPDTLSSRLDVVLDDAESNPGDAVNRLITLRADSEGVLGPDHRLALRVRGGLALQLLAARRPEQAVEELTALTEDRTRVLGADDLTTLAARSNLARAHGAAGDWATSAAGYGQLVADYERTAGPDHDDTLTARSNLAWANARSGQVREAIVQFADLEVAQARVLGADHRNTMVTRRSRIGWQTVLEGPGTEAEWARLIADQSAALGPDHPDTLDSRHHHAWQIADRDRDRAVALFEVLAADQERALGPDHQDTKDSTSALRLYRDGGERMSYGTWLEAKRTAASGSSVTVDDTSVSSTEMREASALGDAGRAGDAVRIMKKVVADRTRLLGSDHPDTLVARNNLAHWTGESGDVERAISGYELLAEDRARLLGEDHPDTLGARSNLAAWHLEAEHFATASGQFRRVADDRSRLLGPNDPKTIDARIGLSRALAGEGKVKASIKERSAIARLQAETLGPDHEDTLRSWYVVARALKDDGQAKQAIERYRTLLLQEERIHGPDHRECRMTRSELASLLGNSGRHDEALRELAVLLEIQQRVLGPDDVSTLISRSNIAYWTAESGDVDEALDLFADLLERRTRALGAFHEDTASTRRTLEKWREVKRKGSGGRLGGLRRRGRHP